MEHIICLDKSVSCSSSHEVTFDSKSTHCSIMTNKTTKMCETIIIGKYLRY